ncbi:methyltransferase domain-containing protein [Hugenholtzia roseola]|uniref:methyltransferase domain-containing protein n=1 Tax=Hugenholtzia roseola TaxID=1002 RepID=UPI0003F85C05|nr:methyltransferase domain-containing protein [Hugenholtzia roseola]
MIDFGKRSYQKELMDELTLEGEDLRRNLEELAFINTHLGGYEVLTSAIHFLEKRKKIDLQQPLSLLDVGSGGGDTLRFLAKYFRRKRWQGNFMGIDANPFMVNYSRMRSLVFPEISFDICDITKPEFENLEADIVICSLFCHHFEDEALIALFRNLKKISKKAFIINDLERNRLAFYAIKSLTHFFSKSYLVKHDAPLSVRRAFKRQELAELLEAAGIKKYRIRWKWAFRYQVIVWQ